MAGAPYSGAVPCAAVVRVADVAAQIGSSDCEELGGGFLAQPVNAITSLFYVAVGLAVVVDALRRGRPTSDTWVFAALLAAVGLGSVAFHGPQPDGARVMHDLPITLTVLYIVAVDVALLRGGRPSRWRLFLPAALVAAGITAIDVDAGTALTGIGVVAVAILEVVIHRRNLRGLDDRARRRSAFLVVAVGVVAAVTWLLGRTDSPACDPASLVQLHAVWHLLSGIVFALWWVLAGRGDVTGRVTQRQPVAAGRP